MSVPDLLQGAGNCNVRELRGLAETYVARAGLVQEYLPVFEGRDSRSTGVNGSACPPVRTPRECITTASRSALVRVYLDLWSARGLPSAHWGASLRKQTQRLRAAVASKQDVGGKALESTGVVVDLDVERAGADSGTPTSHRIGLWLSYVAESPSHKAIMLLLEDAPSIPRRYGQRIGEIAGELALRNPGGRYEAVTSGSSLYHLATLSRELRALWEYDVRSNYSIAADVACLEYIRVTGRALNRDLVWQALQTMGRQSSRSQSRHR